MVSVAHWCNRNQLQVGNAGWKELHVPLLSGQSSRMVHGPRSRDPLRGLPAHAALFGAADGTEPRTSLFDLHIHDAVRVLHDHNGVDGPRAFPLQLLPAAALLIRTR